MKITSAFTDVNIYDSQPLRSEVEAKNALKSLKIIRSGNDIANSIVSNQLSDQEIVDFETSVNQIDKNCKLHRFLGQNFKASHVFGRSASYVELSDKPIDDLKLPAGIPIAIKPLKPMKLGNIIINAKSWNVEGVQYNDSRMLFSTYMDLSKDPTLQALPSQDLERYIPVNNLLYFVRNNDNMMEDEDDYYFGHPSLQTIMNTSEENRRLNQIVIPSINQELWAGRILWTFPNWTDGQMRRFFSGMRPNAHIGIPHQDIKAQVIELKVDYTGLLNLKMELKKAILSRFGIPSFLMNFEAANTKATAETVITALNESTIQSERSWLMEILSDQWYSKIFKAFYPNDKYVNVKMKIIVEFENISFESFLEKAVAVVALVEKKMITLREGRNLLKLPPLLPNDYIELGITPPNNTLIDPATQVAPETPNLLQTLLAQKQQQDQTTGGQESTAVDNRFNSKSSFSAVKSELLSK